MNIQTTLTVLIEYLIHQPDGLFNANQLPIDLAEYQSLQLAAPNEILAPLSKNHIFRDVHFSFNQLNHILSQVRLQTNQLKTYCLLYDVDALKRGQIQPMSNLDMLNRCQKMVKSNYQVG